MDPNYIDLLDYPDSQIDITEYHTDYAILNGRSDKSSSGVWKHFGTLKHNECIDRKHVYCIQCFLNRKIKKYQRSTSTGNLSKHLRKYHRISLNQTFRIKKEPDNDTIVSIQKEQSLNGIDDDNMNGDGDNGDAEEFLIHDINEILIAEVAKRPLLYNSATCQGEKGLKHQTRRQLWTEIYEALNQLIPYARLPKIWKNIRDRYHKVRRSMENASDDYRPRYRYYDALRFLDGTKNDDPTSPPPAENGEEFENYVDEFLVSNENGKYISPEAIDAPTEVEGREVESFEPKPKKVKFSTTAATAVEAQETKRITHFSLPNEMTEEPPEIVSVQNMHLEMNNDSVAGTQILLTQHINPLQLQLPEATQPNRTVSICEKSQIAPKPSLPTKKSDEYEMFGNFMAEVMRNMSKNQSRKLQMSIMGLIHEVESEQS